MPGEASSSASEDSLVARMMEYCQSASFTRAMGAFAEQHASKFHPQDTGAEQPHEWYQLYQAYEALVSERLEDFLAAEGVTAYTAFEACAAAKAAGDARFGGFLDYLVASSEYTAFVELMRDFRGERRDVSRWWLPRGGRCQ